MKRFMRLISPEIEAFQKPFELLQIDGLYGIFGTLRPSESIRFQALEPQTKTIAMPIQHLDLVALTIDEDIERTAKRVSYTHLRAHETKANLVCRLLLE